MEVKTYPRVGYCIYCGRKKHSTGRAKLGDEHIIPEGFGGTLVLPHASCGKCEGLISKHEQFCQKQMLGAFRYKLQLPTKRPKDRPKALPAKRRVGNAIEDIMIPVEEYPVSFMLPMYHLPAMMSEHPLRRTDLQTFSPYPLDILDPGKVEMFARRDNRLMFVSTDSGLVIDSGETDRLRFARMLAKIAHSYTAAHLGPGNFHPILIPAILGDTSYPIHHLIGSEAENPPAENERHRISISTQTFHQREYYVVRVRLFADLGWPQYICISGVPLGARHRLVEKMQEATPYTILSYPRIETGRNPSAFGTKPIDFLCAKCGDAVCSGQKPEDDLTLRCAKCRTWNVTHIEGTPWGIPYIHVKDVPEPIEQPLRAIWIKPSDSIMSETNRT